ncbi:ATP-dependent DNA helicase sgs1, partial [Mortierella polycephala]
MGKFVRGEVLLLTATEAAGMGCDINDVIRVVQFKCPTSITCLVQRLGRAARNPQLQGHGILYTTPPSPSTKYIDPHLAEYITTKECRRKVINKVFGNENQPNGNCCDLCHPSLESIRPLANTILKAVETKGIAMAGVPKRTLAQKERAKAAVLEWRSRVFETDYAPNWSYYTARSVMTENQVKVISENFAKIMAGETVQSIAKWWPRKEEYANELTNILIDLNNEIDDDRRPTLQQKHQAEQVNNDRNKAA